MPRGQEQTHTTITPHGIFPHFIASCAIIHLCLRISCWVECSHVVKRKLHLLPIGNIFLLISVGALTFLEKSSFLEAPNSLLFPGFVLVCLFVF